MNKFIMLSNRHIQVRFCKLSVKVSFISLFRRFVVYDLESLLSQSSVIVAASHASPSANLYALLDISLYYDAPDCRCILCCASYSSIIEASIRIYQLSLRYWTFYLLKYWLFHVAYWYLYTTPYRLRYAVGNFVHMKSWNSEIIKWSKPEKSFVIIPGVSEYW